jgi:hypothetical protein
MITQEKLIPINIIGAKVTAMGFVFEDENSIPEFNATVSLIDDANRKITSINIDSRRYYGSGEPCEKSIRLLELAGQLRAELNILVTQHMNSKQKALSRQEACST